MSTRSKMASLMVAAGLVGGVGFLHAQSDDPSPADLLQQQDQAQDQSGTGTMQQGGTGSQQSGSQQSGNTQSGNTQSGAQSGSQQSGTSGTSGSQGDNTRGYGQTGGMDDRRSSESDRNTTPGNNASAGDPYRSGSSGSDSLPARADRN